MATSNSTTQARRRNGTTDEAELGMESTRNAGETVIRSLRAGVDTSLTFADVSQQVSREIVNLSVTGTKQMLRLWADMQGSMLDALQNGLTPWAQGSPTFRGFQRLVDGGAQAVNRFAETMQGTAEEGTERIKRAVDSMADQIKEGTHQLAQGIEDETNRTRAAASRS
jgi:gas vesicle protein